MRKVVVSYLQAKQVWKPSAAYAGNTARKDPDAMDIGHGKGKGKDGKGKEGKKSKGKESKGKSKESHTSGKGTKSNESKDISFLLAGLLSVRCAPVSEGTKACKEAKAKRGDQTKPSKNQNTNKKTQHNQKHHNHKKPLQRVKRVRRRSHGTGET